LDFSTFADTFSLIDSVFLAGSDAAFSRGLKACSAGTSCEESAASAGAAAPL